MNEINWDQFLVKEPKQEEPKIDWEKFAVPEKKEFPEVKRHVARSASRIGETLLGLPGDILSIPESIAKSGLKKLPGVKEETLEKFRVTNLPRSSDLKNISEKIFGKTVKPQSEMEKLSDDIVSDTAALAIPFKGRIPFLRSIGTAVAGNLSSEAAKSLGLGEKGQTAAKLGTFFLAGLTGKGNVKKFWNQEYKLANESIPEGAKINAKNLDTKLYKLEEELKKGGIETPSQKAVTKPLNELRDVISRGEISVQDAVEAKRKINELRASLFEEVKEKGARHRAKVKLNDLASYLDETLESYGKENPKFLKHWEAGNEAYGGYYQSKKIGNWIKNNLPLPSKVSKLGLLALEGFLKPATIPYTAAGYAAFKGGELLTRMFKNPTLRKYYSNLIKSAADENKAAFSKNLRALDHEMKKNPEEWEEFLARDNEAD